MLPARADFPSKTRRPGGFYDLLRREAEKPMLSGRRWGNTRSYFALDLLHELPQMRPPRAVYGPPKNGPAEAKISDPVKGQGSGKDKKSKSGFKSRVSSFKNAASQLVIAALGKKPPVGDIDNEGEEEGEEGYAQYLLQTPSKVCYGGNGSLGGKVPEPQ